jgi:ABC-type bacteriocin/lantibiotic exporter with double-glycine peptidase domain
MTNKKRCIGIAIVVFAVAIVNSSWIVRPPDLKQHPSGWYAGGEYQGREGVIFQTSYNDCGPAALQMIFEHYKISITLDEIERSVRLTGNGTTMLSLKQMAELKGLHAEGWRLTVNDFLNTSFPLLLFVHNDHFVVADSVCNRIVFLRDPAIGKVEIPTTDLPQIWRGEALVFAQK